MKFNVFYLHTFYTFNEFLFILEQRLKYFFIFIIKYNILFFKNTNYNIYLNNENLLSQNK